MYNAAYLPSAGPGVAIGDAFPFSAQSISITAAVLGGVSMGSGSAQV